MAANWKPQLAATRAAVLSTFTQLRGKIDTIITRLNAHTAATGNVHDLSAADLALENLPNYPAATKVQAEEATNNASLMTPTRTREWAETNVYYPIGKAFGDAADRL